MKRVFSFLLCIGILAFLLLAPAIIAGGVGKNVYSLREEEKRGKFQGSLVLWHVVSFKTGGSSGVSYLRQAASNFERQNPYVFIDVQGMTPEEAQERLASGESPDILSFPMGFVEEGLMPLEEATGLLPAYETCGKQGMETYAYPYMADYYTLVCNQDAFSTQEVPLPFDGAMSYENFVLALEKLPSQDEEGKPIQALALSNVFGIHPEMALCYLRLTEEEDEFLEEAPVNKPLASFDIDREGGSEAFLNGEASMLLCPSSEFVQLSADKRANSMSLSALTLTSYTDLVQMIGVPETEDAKKAAMCQSFCSTLLKTRYQEGLEPLKMLPVTQVEDIYDGQELEEYTYLGAQGKIPNTWLLASQKDQIEKEAWQVLEKPLDQIDTQTLDVLLFTG